MDEIFDLQPATCKLHPLALYIQVWDIMLHYCPMHEVLHSSRGNTSALDHIATFVVQAGPARRPCRLIDGFILMKRNLKVRCFVQSIISNVELGLLQSRRPFWSTLPSKKVALRLKLTKEEYERLLVQAVLFSVRFHCTHTEFFTEFQAVAVSVITYLPFLTRRKLICSPVA